MQDSKFGIIQNFASVAKIMNLFYEIEQHSKQPRSTLFLGTSLSLEQLDFDEKTGKQIKTPIVQKDPKQQQKGKKKNVNSMLKELLISLR